MESIKEQFSELQDSYNANARLAAQYLRDYERTGDEAALRCAMEFAKDFEEVRREADRLLD